MGPIETLFTGGRPPRADGCSLRSTFSDHSRQVPYLQGHDAKSALPLPAGYDPSMSPETFIKLGKAEAAMRKSMGGNLGALQCTHPRSDSRVQMLQEELALMQVRYSVAACAALKDTLLLHVLLIGLHMYGRRCF